ncbi:MAG: presqualene diphosphate synthase HpnD [Nitrospirales bacterium]|nr:MAG: presqualene diphosphate synthase HpnD [Nitrospirales bacterium]
MKPMSPIEAQTFCTTYTQKSGSNFYYSFLFLPQNRREAMYTIYAFCKMVDSAVDEPAPGSHPMEEVLKWRQEVTATYQGHPTQPVTISLAAHLQTFDIPESLLQELITGVEMDLTINRFTTFADLYQYCYRVASVVGLICLKIFQTQSPAAEDYAVNLGLAFQLTNILRDLKGDAEQNRIYLPLEDLQRFGYSEEALLHQQESPALIDLIKFECERAHTYYQQAQDILHALPPSDRKSLVVAEIMRGVYSRILKQLEDQHYQVFGPRIRVAPMQRLGIAAHMWIRSFFSRGIAPSM